MNLEDEFKYLIGAYYGIRSMDNYELKEYILKDIEIYIRNFIKENKILNFDYKKRAQKIDDEMPLITKLQDSLLLLPKINAPMELVLLVKKTIIQLKEEETKERNN